jgi:hypothetical protein
VTVTLDDPLLGWPLPVDDPAGAARTADGLLAVADRLSALGRRVASMLPVQRWSGVASAAADQRLALTTFAVGLERRRVLRAADALTRFSRQVAAARTLADDATRLLTAARAAQQAADLADTGATGSRPSGGWGGYRADGALYDPHAVVLLDRARERAYDSRTCYDRAARRLTAELTELSGRRVVRGGMSARAWLDLAGFVPVVGDAVDAVNAGVYFAQGRWREGLLTAVAVVPGPGGWVAGGAKVGKALDHTGDVAKVVDDVPAETRAIEVLSQLTVRGDRRTTRMLPDDESIERLYREHLEGLGPTAIVKAGNETVSVTTLPSGASIAFRRFSNSDGYAIEVRDLPRLGYDRVHRPRD